MKIALFLLIALFVVAALASVRAGDAAQGKIDVTATLAVSQTEAVPPQGRQSDLVTQSWRLNDRSGTRVGRMMLVCRWVISHSRYCSGEVRMPKGKLTVAGTSPTAFDGIYAVTGGTGIYRGSSGTMEFAAIGERKTVLSIEISM